MISSFASAYDEPLFEELLQKFRTGRLDGATKAGMRYATSNEIPHASAKNSQVDRGLSLISAGEVGAVILAGGLATRFGGAPKAMVDLKPGWPLLRVKLQALDVLAASNNVTLQVIVVVSFSTEEAVETILEACPMDHLRIRVVRQSALPRILEDGRLVRDGEGNPSLNPPGHGEVLRLLSAHGWSERGVPTYWQISNIDNLLATLDPSVVGTHANSGSPATVEITLGSKNDVGGFIAISNRGFEVIEGFQVKSDERPRGEFFFSTNTFIVGRAAADAGTALPFHAIRKQLPDGRTAVQFEQLLGDVGRVVPLNVALVPREGLASRFMPLKRVEDLDGSRDFLVAALNATGLLHW